MGAPAGALESSSPGVDAAAAGGAPGSNSSSSSNSSSPSTDAAAPGGAPGNSSSSPGTDAAGPISAPGNSSSKPGTDAAAPGGAPGNGSSSPGTDAAAPGGAPGSNPGADAAALSGNSSSPGLDASAGIASGRRLAASGAPPKYFITGNLRNNQDVTPHIVVQLLNTVLQLPADTVYVSLYESASTDATATWLDILELSLNVLRIPNRIVARGPVVRPAHGEERITFLSRVRNAAMAPLYEHYLRAGAGGASKWPLYGDALAWSPDYVVVMSDVFLCWSDVIRLMNHRADIACGMDFWQHGDATAALSGSAAVKARAPKPTLPPQLSLERNITVATNSDTSNPIVFYDIWVSRDIGGSKFWWTYPFVTDAESGEAVKKGLPFKASCCWNGLMVARAAPFAAGLRFRDAQAGECRAAEPTLLCNDFHRLGLSNVVVDAGVQIVYTGKFETAREVMRAGIEGVARTTWEQAKQAGVAGASRRPALESNECCNLQPGAMWVNFYSDCLRENILATNFTQQALETNFTPVAGWGQRRLRGAAAGASGGPARTG